MNDTLTFVFPKFKEEYSDKGSMNIHIVEEHQCEKVKIVNSEVSNVNELLCEECDFTCTTNDSINIHSQTHENLKDKR